MPKQPKYQLEKVLEGALPLVLELGYRGCSMATLISSTGFNRRAFYIQFHNKEDFFEALLNHYLHAHLMPLNQYLRESFNVQECIHAYFKAYQQHIHRKGCLLTKLVLEMGNENNAIQHQARWFYDQLQLDFIALLERAQQHDMLAKNVNVEQQALKLTCLAQGFAISNQIVQGEEDATLLIESIFSLPV
ncbi:TetR/AcrR family transcriptional regulator [Glaciecola sp. XM2]|uniref:TetR/AcrR family transcriptional regulator n=1 Tax=Glaciecola sp. XM2 TaxID=1914931 RepID=UPI001BDE8A41|nr:TetR/AcrR family transcriptional regulator [Glaciecola sp. XM2]MBT1451912.1 TetR/AcrR family transcriptional regulator [Glaciecola sp. XM2]